VLISHKYLRKLLSIFLYRHSGQGPWHVILREQLAANQSRNPKAKATEESSVQAGWKINFDLTQQKQSVALERKDSSSADHYLPNNKVRGWPPQNNKP
jgi:hypothetical protein